MWSKWDIIIKYAVIMTLIKPQIMLKYWIKLSIGKKKITSSTVIEGHIEQFVLLTLI